MSLLAAQVQVQVQVQVRVRAPEHLPAELAARKAGASWNPGEDITTAW